MFKILSIDGGGVRGIIPAVILTALEARAGKPIAEMFDLIAGSSTGGLLTLALTKPDESGQPAYTAQDCITFYEQESANVFSRTNWHRLNSLGNIRSSKYQTDGIEEVLERYFGETMLADALTDILITGYEIQQRQPWLFRRFKARDCPECNFSMQAVGRATTAAPTYFMPQPLNEHYAMLDGAIMANNPAMCAYVEAHYRYPDEEEFMIISLGTGDNTRPIAFEDAKDWGLASWAQQLFDIMNHASSSNVDYQLKRLLPPCKDGKQHYYRLQIPLIGASDDIDDVEPSNIQALKGLGEQLVASYTELLDDLVEQLTHAPQPQEAEFFDLRRWFTRWRTHSA